MSATHCITHYTRTTDCTTRCATDTRGGQVSYAELVLAAMATTHTHSPYHVGYIGLFVNACPLCHSDLVAMVTAGGSSVPRRVL